MRRWVRDVASKGQLGSHVVAAKPQSGCTPTSAAPVPSAGSASGSFFGGIAADHGASMHTSSLQGVHLVSDDRKFIDTAMQDAATAVARLTLVDRGRDVALEMKHIGFSNAEIRKFWGGKISKAAKPLGASSAGKCLAAGAFRLRYL